MTHMYVPITGNCIARVKSKNEQTNTCNCFVERSHLIELCTKVIFRRRHYALNENKDWKHRKK